MLLYLWVRSSAGVGYHGVASPKDAVPVLTLACPAGSVMASLHVVCLQPGCWFHSSLLGSLRCQPLYGRLDCCWACCASAGVVAVVLVGRRAST